MGPRPNWWRTCVYAMTLQQHDSSDLPAMADQVRLAAMSPLEESHRPQLTGALGVTVRRLRRYQGLSQAEFAERAGLATNHVGEIERAGREPKLQTIVSLASGLGIQASELLARAEAFAREQALVPPRS